jgi:hypothetical protein
MSDDEIFESEIRSAGDLGAVFEYDGETSYFYLYATENPGPKKILAHIHIRSGKAGFTQQDVAVRWNHRETRVGLFLRERLRAVFDVESGEKYGPDDGIPGNVAESFGSA